MNFTPAYLALFKRGELRKRAQAAREILSSCTLCPHLCKVNRLQGDLGVCRGGALAKVSSVGPHYGEEPPLVGRGGSGTVFFAYCNLLCVFCQNYDLSHWAQGSEVNAGELANYMIHLQSTGCHNINFVTPTHNVAPILEALPLAVEAGLRLPLVYNCGGYESLETLALLEGIIDIYMPDAKFWDSSIAREFTNADDYPQRMQEALKEMHRQVGDLVLDERGLALRGLLVRHLVLPQDKAGTYPIMKFIAEEISPHTYVNVMRQYRPAYKAREYPPLSRRITEQEFARAQEIAHNFGLNRGLEY